MVKVIIFYRYYNVAHAVYGPMWVHHYVQCEIPSSDGINLWGHVKKESGLSERAAMNMEVTGMVILP